MFDSYSEIFDARGASYQQAMERFPQARSQEFQSIIELADLQPALEVYDMPSGGAYLNWFVDTPLNITAVETSEGFSGSAQTSDPILCDSLEAVPLADASADRIISLAGLHHIYPRLGVYREFFRLLKPRGILALADVDRDTGTARFLNGFVDTYTTTGHEGVFLQADTRDALAGEGFAVEQNAVRTLRWCFPSRAAMGEFCQQLFGLELARSDQVIDAIREHLGFEAQSDGVAMNWELRFIKARKPEAA